MNTPVPYYMSVLFMRSLPGATDIGYEQGVLCFSLFKIA
jgi:hypothetical protein